MPADLVSLSPRMLTPPRRASASASCGEKQDSSAMIGTSTRRPISAMPSRSQRGTGCSTKSRPYGLERADGPERGRPVPALVGVHAQRDSGPSASRSRRTRATSSAHGRAPVFTLKMRWPAATLARASSISASVIGDGERPGQRHAVAHAAAEEPVHGHAERPRVQDPRAPSPPRRGRRDCPGRGAPSRGSPPRSPVASEPREPGRDVALDDRGDGLRRLLAPRRTAQAGRLAPAHLPVRGLEADEDEVHRLECREGHLVGTAHGDVCPQSRARPRDLHGRITTRRRSGRCERRLCRRNPFPRLGGGRRGPLQL